MLRKLMAATALTAMVALTACNNITGPETVKGSSQNPGGPGPQPPRQIEKVCLSDNRAIQITAPAEGRLLYGGDALLITWDLAEVCGHYWADVEVSVDNGRTFVNVRHALDAVSATWSIPNTGGAAVVLRVTIHDGVGDLSQDVAFNNRLIVRNLGHTHNNHPNQFD